jgi:hypothetical protein
VAKWNGTAWVCAPDTGTSDWSGITGIPAGFADGIDNDTDTNTDTLAALSCAAGEIAAFNGSAWVCSPDLASLQAAVATLQSQVSTLQAENAALQDKLQYVTVNGTDMYVTGANLHVRSGSGATNGTINGLGNLVIGYNESRGPDDDRAGSHNLVVGSEQNFSSYGGLVAGFHNSLLAAYASVSGGQYNMASGSYASITGGQYNKASGNSSMVAGGGSTISTYGNHAYSDRSAILGGIYNITGIPSGGNHDTGHTSTVTGGDTNKAEGIKSTVNGGKLNTASGDISAVSGGYNNTAGAAYSTVSGGNGITESTSSGHSP